MNINKVNPNLVIIAALAIGGYFAYNNSRSSSSCRFYESDSHNV
jgi:hypothetical protein